MYSLEERTLDGNQQSVSRPLYRRAERPWYSMRLGGPQSRSECFGEEMLVPVTTTAERGLGPGKKKTIFGSPRQGGPARRKVRK